VRMMDGAHHLWSGRLPIGEDARAVFGIGTSRRAPVRKSVEGNRVRLRQILGAVDAREPVRMERFGDDGDSPLVAETEPLPRVRRYAGRAEDVFRR